MEIIQWNITQFAFSLRQLHLHIPKNSLILEQHLTSSPHPEVLFDSGEALAARANSMSSSSTPNSFVDSKVLAGWREMLSGRWSLKKSLMEMISTLRWKSSLPSCHIETSELSSSQISMNLRIRPSTLFLNSCWCRKRRSNKMTTGVEHLDAIPTVRSASHFSKDADISTLLSSSSLRSCRRQIHCKSTNHLNCRRHHRWSTFWRASFSGKVWQPEDSKGSCCWRLKHVPFPRARLVFQILTSNFYQLLFLRINSTF